MKNLGSDIQWLADRGIPIRTDDSEWNHMHNKFILADYKFVLTGSFNFTQQAADSNQENVLVVDNPFYIFKYNEYFDKLWVQFSAQEVPITGETF